MIMTFLKYSRWWRTAARCRVNIAGQLVRGGSHLVEHLLHHFWHQSIIGRSKLSVQVRIKPSLLNQGFRDSWTVRCGRFTQNTIIDTWIIISNDFYGLSNNFSTIIVVVVRLVYKSERLWSKFYGLSLPKRTQNLICTFLSKQNHYVVFE